MQEEEKERAILTKVQAFLGAEVLINDYPTEEEWAALCDETSAEEEKEQSPSPIDLFHPNISSISSNSSALINPSTLSPAAPHLPSPNLFLGKSHNSQPLMSPHSIKSLESK